MLQYRLLRDNRETGPYSLGDLVALPLKAYDLIWVDGRSAAWKYPSEYEELKAHAPAVTDDFYQQFHAPVATTPKAVEPIRKNGENKTHKKAVSIILPESPAFSAVIAQTVAMAPVAEKLHIDWPKPHRKSMKPYIGGGLVLLALVGGIYFFSSYYAHTSAATDSTANTNNIVTYTANTPAANNMIVVSPLEFAVLKKDLTLRTNDYGDSFFGGINDLQLTIANKGTTVLRDIIVQVDYLAKDKAILDVETIHFGYLQAGASQTADAPASDKAVAVQTRIISVNGFRSSDPIH
ncbi:MAG TPA: hypothetical protein PLQ32_10730 [Flavihumibacter sp.]|nr:hypothetical protein [Flavihumibacter sp.]